MPYLNIILETLLFRTGESHHNVTDEKRYTYE